MTIEEINAQKEYAHALYQVKDASDRLKELQKKCDLAFNQFKKLCSHTSGFAWNGFGSYHSQANWQCRSCDTYRNDVKING